MTEYLFARLSDVDVTTVQGLVDEAEAARDAALNSQNAAAISAGDALTAQGAAEAAQALAEQAATDAEAAFASFDAVYLGSKTADPTLDNEGNALVEGQLYWNSVSNQLRVYDGASWSGYAAQSGITSVVEDTSPQLGGNLDLNGNVITGLEIGTDVQAHSSILDATDASFTTTLENKLANIEANADVTDATNVASAGAVMESDYDAHTILAATSDNTPAPVTVAEQRIVGRTSGGNIAALTGAQALAIVGYPPGFLYGLTLSNNVTDATNDIDIAAGSCRAAASSSVVANMDLGSALTKRLDAAWAVGTGNGGLDTGSIADTTYHVHLIRRSDTGVVDALFSTSATAPTMPANYDSFRRIGSIRRIGGAIKAFTQLGDEFTWITAASDYSSTSSRSEALIAVTVPSGVALTVKLLASLTVGTTGFMTHQVGTPGAAILVPCAQGVAGVNARAFIVGGIESNTSAQINHAVTISSGTLSSCFFETHGFFDRRGQDGGA